MLGFSQLFEYVRIHVVCWLSYPNHLYSKVPEKNWQKGQNDYKKLWRLRRTSQVTLKKQKVTVKNFPALRTGGQRQKNQGHIRRVAPKNLGVYSYRFSENPVTFPRITFFFPQKRLFLQPCTRARGAHIHSRTRTHAYAHTG